MNCGLVQRYVDAYVDLELDPGTSLEVERHLEVCAPCQEGAAFARAMKGHVRTAMADVHAPEGLRDRIRRSLDEAPRVGVAQPLVKIAPMRLKHAIPLAAAAAVLMATSFAVGPFSTSVSTSTSASGAGKPPGIQSLAATASTVPFLEDAVRVHASDLPADVPGEHPQEVTRWFRNKVNFPVRPARFERDDAHLLGARLSNVRERRAAALYYDVGGERVTVVLFDRPERARSLRLQRTHLLGREVSYQQVGGYTVPIRDQGGVTYAFIGDLDRQSLLRLVATARVPQ